ncbi:MAG TPA: O-antigen ligase family protein [bacterium]|nr:O-antigen ligase family protein [bacterium]
MSGIRVETGALPAMLAVGTAAVVLPFLVVPAWYDAYYWPKVCLLYAAVAAGALSLLRTNGGAWLRDLGAPIGAALGAWLGALTLATALSVNPLLSFVGDDYRYEGLLTWLAYGALAAVSASTLRNPRRLRAILGLILAAAGVMSAIALLQHVGISPVPADLMRRAWIRASGTTGSPLALGAYAVLLLPLIVGVYAESRRGRQVAYGALAAALYAALIATEARAGWGALAVGLAVWGVTSGKAAVRAAARPLVVLAVVCAAVTPAVLLTGSHAALGHVSDAGSAASRVFIWRTAAPLVAARPVFGWGPDTLSQIYPAYGTPAFVRVFPEAAMQHIVVDRPHNDVLQQAISAGLVGLAAYLWFWYMLFYTAWKTARARAHGDHGLRRGDDRRSPLVDPAVIGPGLAGGFAAYFAQLQLSFSYVSVAPLFWVLVGAIAALRPRVVWGGRLRSGPTGV